MQFLWLIKTPLIFINTLHFTAHKLISLWTEKKLWTEKFCINPCAVPFSTFGLSLVQKHSQFWEMQCRVSKFSFLSNKQYFIWKLTTSAKIWYPIEVSKVEIRVSGVHQNGHGPGKIKFEQKSWNLQLLSYMVECESPVFTILWCPFDV